MVYSVPNNSNSIVYQHTLLSYELKTSHWNFSRAATLYLCNMADRGEKLQQPHCYHPFSDSRDTYLTKNHYENYSPKMVPTNPTGAWTKIQRSCHWLVECLKGLYWAQFSSPYICCPLVRSSADMDYNIICMPMTASFLLHSAVPMVLIVWPIRRLSFVI